MVGSDSDKPCLGKSQSVYSTSTEYGNPRPLGTPISRMLLPPESHFSIVNLLHACLLLAGFPIHSLSGYLCLSNP